jgi:HSP20 family protein
MVLTPYRNRGFFGLQGELSRLFDEAFGGLLGRTGRPGLQVSEWAPTMDVISRDGDLVLQVELPGVRLEDVDVAVQDGMLTISGEHKVEQEEEREDYFVRERRYGSFRRSMALPEGVSEDDIRARFRDGVLEVTLKGAAIEQEPRRIQIAGGEN